MKMINTDLCCILDDYHSLALKQGIKILSKKRLTSKDFRKLETLTKIIFDVNSFKNLVVSDQLAKSRSFVRASQDPSSQQTSTRS